MSKKITPISERAKNAQHFAPTTPPGGWTIPADPWPMLLTIAEQDPTLGLGNIVNVYEAMAAYVAAQPTVVVDIRPFPPIWPGIVPPVMGNCRSCGEPLGNYWVGVVGGDAAGAYHVACNDARKANAQTPVLVCRERDGECPTPVKCRADGCPLEPPSTGGE